MPRRSLIKRLNHVPIDLTSVPDFGYDDGIVLHDKIHYAVITDPDTIAILGLGNLLSPWLIGIVLECKDPLKQRRLNVTSKLLHLLPGAV